MQSLSLLNENNDFNDLISTNEQKEKNELSNYMNLSSEEIIEKINDKKKNIIEYLNINKSLKKELTDILEKLNAFSKTCQNKISINEKDLLAMLNNKKLEYIKFETNNTVLKDEYNTLLKSMKEISENNLSNIIIEKRMSIDKLKEENFEIKKEIIKSQSDNVKKQNKVIKLRNTNLYLQNLDLYSFKLKKYLDGKNKCIKAFNMTSKMIKEKMKEVNNIENIINIKNKIYSKNETVFNKIKEDLNRIKIDLSDVIEEINKKSINQDILIINNMIQKTEDSTHENTMNNININTLNKRSNIFITKSPIFNYDNPKKICNNRIINTNKSIKLKPILRKNNSSSNIQFNNPYIFSNHNLSNYNPNLKRISLLYSNKSTIDNNNYENTLTGNNEQKIIPKKNVNCFSCDFTKLRFKETDDEAYHNLLNRKENYMEESDRLSKNIKETNRAFIVKYNKIVNNLKKNINKLNEIKIINTGVQNEIKKLQDLMKRIKEENKKSIDNNKVLNNI